MQRFSTASSLGAAAAAFAAIFTVLVSFTHSQCLENGNEIKDSSKVALCSAFSISATNRYDPYLCQSIVCYSITAAANATSLLSWRIQGEQSSIEAQQPAPAANKYSTHSSGEFDSYYFESQQYDKPTFDASKCPASDSAGSFIPSRNSRKLFENTFISVNSTRDSTQIDLQRCYNYSGMATIGLGEIWLSLADATCIFEAPVALKITSCAPKDCTLDTSQPEVFCGSCTASCLLNEMTNVATRTCSYPVLQPAANNGAECPTATTTLCTSSCTRNCLMTLEPKSECTANIIQRTVTMTQSWKTSITPELGGIPCNTSLSYTTYTCSKDFYPACALDYSNPTCEECRGQCNGVDGLISSTRRCTYSTLNPGEIYGQPCPDPTFDLPCVQICAVNCKMELEPETSWTPNCLKPTEMVVRKWQTVIKPQYGGALCPLNLLPVTKMYSMSPREQFLKCGGECVVDGDLMDPCYLRCKNGESPPFVATATYPLTIRSNLPGFKPCPTLTTTCQCTDCVLNPIPTRVGDCEASCVLGDLYAIGAQTLYYTRLQAGVGAADLRCNTKSLRLCQTQCTCQFTTQIAESCTYTKTLSDASKWTALGNQKITLLGEDPNCMQVSTIGCQSILKAQDCIVNAQCPSCSCTPVLGPKYTISTSQACALTTLRAAFAGGKACPAQPPVSLCYKECPGCNYPLSYCSCAFTEVADETVFIGNPVCTYAPDEQNDLPNGMNDRVCPQSTKTKIAEGCTRNVQPDRCAYETSTCNRCVKTRTLLDSGTYFAAGYRECIMTDLRNVAAPNSCTTTRQTMAKCTLSLAPVDCKVVDYCSACQIANMVDDLGPAEYAVGCTRKTLVTQAFGGKQCPAVTKSKVTCKKELTQVQPDSIFKEPYISQYNAIILSNADTSSTIEGGAIICGDAALNSVSVGDALKKTSAVCSSSYPSLFVGGSLLMTGTINSGHSIINGTCSSETIAAKCGMRCLTSSKFNEADCDSFKLFDCAYFRTAMLNDFGLMDVTWSGTGNETLSIINAIPNMTLKLVFNRFFGTLKPDSTIIINIDSAAVSFTGLSMAYFKYMPEYIIWNLPNTKQIEINGIQVMGTIIAPKAKVYGVGAINGLLIADSIVGSSKYSVNLIHAPFKGNIM